MLKLVGLTNCRMVSVELDIYTSEVVTALETRFYQNDSFLSDVIETLSNFVSNIKFCEAGITFTTVQAARSRFECYVLYQGEKDGTVHRWAFECFQATIGREGA